MDEINELENYIKSTLTSIENGMKGSEFELVKPVEFNLAVINTAEGGGGLKIYVAEAGGKLKSEEISHIKFEIQPKSKTANVFRPPNQLLNSSR